MTNLPSDPTPSGAPQRPAEFPHRTDASAEGARQGAGSDDPQAGYAQAETALGGADSVQKTSYVVGSGTEPSAEADRRGTARVPSGGGMNIGLIVVVVVAIAIALVYGFGLFS